MFPDYKVRVFANACITRYTRGESDIRAVLASYGLDEDNANLIKAEIMSKRPDIEWETNAN